MRALAIWSAGAGLAAGVALAPGAASAQSAAPPSWETLVRCAQMADSDDELACYREAMRAAGFRADPKVVEADRKRRFGLSLPSLRRRGDTEAPAQAARSGAAPAAAEPEDDSVTVEIAQVALIPPMNRLLLITADGGVWEQTDTDAVNPRPRPGRTFEIRRTGMGGYFCRFGRVSVRCKRTQ